MRRNWWAGVLVALLPAPLAAQSLAERVQAAGDGTVRLSFAAREGVCSRGPGSITVLDGDADDEEWESDCQRGPIRVSLRMQGGRVVDSETYVGGRWRAGRGRVKNEELRKKILFSVSQMEGAENAKWLVSVARDRAQPVETRKQALFWAGQGGASLADLTSLYNTMDEREMREQLIFVYSQREEPAAVDKLLEIARRDSDPELRKKALFWLGQSDDPRAAKALQDIIEQP